MYRERVIIKLMHVFTPNVIGKAVSAITQAMFSNQQFMSKTLQEQSIGPAIRRWLGVFSLLRTRMVVQIKLEESGTLHLSHPNVPISTN